MCGRFSPWKRLKTVVAMGESVMRNLRSPAWAQSILSAATLMLAVAGLAPSAAAEDKFKTLFVFGDSYADTTLAGVWRVYPLPLQENLGIPVMVDFAVGGARASPIGPPAVVFPGWHLQQQVDEFLKAGTLIGPRDLVTLNIGGNDGLGLLGGAGPFIGYPIPVGPMTVANAPDFAKQTADFAVAQIDRLVKDAGAKTFVLGGFSGMSGLQRPEVTAAPLVADAYGQAYFSEMQTKLVPLAHSGVRLFMLDLHRLGQQVEGNLSGYGLIGVKCPVGVLVCGNDINSELQKQYFLGPDGLHLTEAGFKIVADYMANIVLAPDTIAVQPGIVATTTGGFAYSLLGRLSATREAAIVSGFLPPKAADGPMGLGHGEKTYAPQAGRFTAYTMGTFLGGSRNDAPDLVGFEYDSTSGTVGVEYSVNRNLIFGLAGNYTITNADLSNGANVDVDALQAAAYVSYATKQIFADLLAAYGSHDVGLVRPGVIDAVRSNTDAASIALAARAGYLFDFGSLRAGPIAGLTYIHTRVDGYTEKGDPLLTFNVSAQTLDSLTGNIGLRFLAPFQAGRNVVVPYLNITLEHQFGDGDRTFTASLVQAPLLPILSPVPTFDTRTYGKIEGGITFQIGTDISATISAASTFAREEGHDFRLSTGLNYRF